MRAKGPQRARAQSELAESRCAGDGVSKWQPWEVATEVTLTEGGAQR